MRANVLREGGFISCYVLRAWRRQPECFRPRLLKRVQADTSASRTGGGGLSFVVDAAGMLHTLRRICDQSPFVIPIRMIPSRDQQIVSVM